MPEATYGRVGPREAPDRSHEDWARSRHPWTGMPSRRDEPPRRYDASPAARRSRRTLIHIEYSFQYSFQVVHLVPELPAVGVFLAELRRIPSPQLGDVSGHGGPEILLEGVADDLEVGHDVEQD